jgi:PAS domain S-box-containing protein
MNLPFRRSGSSAQPVSAFAVAIAVPFLFSAISVYVVQLHPVPYALNFLAVIFIATLYGTRPSLIALLTTIVARAICLYAAGQPPLNRSDAARMLILLLGALISSLLTRSQRKSAAELQIAHSALQDRTAALIESLHASKCASWTIDVSTRTSARWYSGSYQVFGRPFAELERLDSLASLLHPDDQSRMPELVQLMQTTTDPIVWEYRATWPNGETHWLEMRATRIPGKGILWRGLTVDITERKLAEAALLLYLARTDDALSPTTRSYLATAEQELARLGDITRLTLGFVRNGVVPTDIEIAVVVEEVLAIFRHRLESKGILLERDFQPGVQIHIAAHELRQILTNLISNAVDALNPSTSGKSSRIAIRIAADADSVQLEVEDNGSGIAQSELSRIFDPFFTTKHDVGTGIGLWVTHELVTTNGGRISVESGDLPSAMKTRFRIDFPQPRPQPHEAA